MQRSTSNGPASSGTGTGSGDAGNPTDANGANGDAGTGGTSGDDQGAPANGQPSTDDATGGTGGTGGTDPGNGQGDQGGDDLANLDSARLAAMVRDLRAENARTRTGAKTAAADQARREAVETITKALGMATDDDADPAKVAAEAQRQARDAAVELAVYKAASKHQADPDALLDSRGFVKKTADLDPTAADFADQVASLIGDEVKNNPKYKAAGQAPAASGVGHSGGSGDRGTSRPKNLAEALNRRYGT